MAEPAGQAQDAALATPRVHEAGYTLLSHRFRLRTSSPAGADLVERTFGRFRADVNGVSPGYELEELPGERQPFRLLLDGTCLIKSARPARVFDYFVWHVMREAVSGLDHFLVHAGVVTWGNDAIVLPARSGSGKTTLVAGLVRAGFDYLSDEIAAIDPATWRVTPFPLSLSVKPGSMDLLADVVADLPDHVRPFVEGRYPLRPSDIRPNAVGAPARVRHIIAPRYEPGASTVLEPCSRGRGLVELGENAFNFPSFGRRGLYLLASVAREARCFRLRVGDLDEAVSAISRLVRGRHHRPRPVLAEPLGEHVSIPHRFVVAPARGRLETEPLEAGQSVEQGTVIGRVRNGREVYPVVAHVAATFASWLASDGERVSPSRLLARLDGGGG